MHGDYLEAIGLALLVVAVIFIAAFTVCGAVVGLIAGDVWHWTKIGFAIGLSIDVAIFLYLFFGGR